MIHAINALGPNNAIEQPLPGDPDFTAKVTAWQAAHPGVSEEHAVLGCVLAERDEPVDETRMLLDAKTSANLTDGPSASWLAELGRRILGS